MTKRDQLTPKQARFVEEYMIDLNGTQAAIRAGYSEKGASVRGTQLLANDKVSAAVQKRRAQLQKSLEITQEKVLREYARLSFWDPACLYGEDGELLAIQDMDENTRRAIRGMDISEEVFETIDSQGNITSRRTTRSIKPRMADKRPALQDLGRHLGLFEDEKDLRPVWLELHY